MRSVHPLGDFGTTVSDRLGAEQASARGPGVSEQFYVGTRADHEQHENYWLRDGFGVTSGKEVLQRPELGDQDLESVSVVCSSRTRAAMSSRTSRIRSTPSMPRSDGSSVSQF